jgi:hypothetical protein
LNSLWLKDLWQYRKGLFQAINNVYPDVSFRKEDPNFLNRQNIITFLESILISVWKSVPPHWWSLKRLTTAIRPNKNLKRNIFREIKEKFVKFWVFNQPLFENALRNPILSWDKTQKNPSSDWKEILP